MTNAPLELELEMIPLNVVSVEVPEVSVAVPREIEPAPAIEPTVSEMLFKSHVAPLETLTGVESDSVPLPDIYSIPAVTFVAPVYVLAADSVAVPAEDFVKIPVPVAIGVVTEREPATSIVRFLLVAETAFVDPLSVSPVLESTWISASAASETVPVMV